MSDINQPGNKVTGTGNPSAVTDNHSGHGRSVGQAPSSAFSASYALALSKTSHAQRTGLGSDNVPTFISANPHGASTIRTGSAPVLSVRGEGHIPLAGQQKGSDKHNLHETALALRAYRQQLLASNIANADTPNYKAVDIDIAEALRNGQSTSANIPLKYHVPSQGSVDGNTVEMDVERAKFAENALMYEYEVDRVKGHGQMLLELLRNLPY